jgi:hypothetical protein
MKWLLILMVVVVVVAINYYYYLSAREALVDALARNHVDMLSVSYSVLRSGKYRMRLDFTGVARGSGEGVTGHAICTGWGRDNVEVKFDGEFDRLAHLRSLRSDEAYDVGHGADELDLETRILFETNQRLERLHGDREAFLANDLDGDGSVDAEEWDLVRARMESEVRAELEGAPLDASAAEDAEPNSPSAPAEPEAVEEEAVEDGHW